MLTKHAIISTLSLFAAVPVMAAGSGVTRVSVPPASFLNYHVSTVHELSQEVTLDPTVRARLANHFHITEAQLTEYVRRNLVLTHLKKGGSYSVACVGRDGREYWIESHLPAGTAIFASRVTGHPILKLACGNPMVSSLPPSIQTAEDNGNIGPAKFADLPPPSLSDSSPLPGLLLEELTPGDLLAFNTAVAPVVVQVADFPPIGSIVGAGSHSFNALPAILGGLALGVAGTGHGGSSSNAVVPPPAIPEASTSASFGGMLLLGTGALFLARRKRVAKKTE